MIPIRGFEGYISLNELTKVSDLIYYDGPLLSHYVHPNGDNYLSYWVDCDESFQRWLVFRVGLSMLQKYVNRNLSLYNLIRNVSDGFVYLVDVDVNGVANTPMMVAIKNLPDDYLPDLDSYYDFSLEKNADVESLSLSEQCGLFEIHLSGDDIKYGNMPFEKYTECLKKIEDLRHTCAGSFIRQYKRTAAYRDLSPDRKKKKLAELNLNTKFQYLYSLAGSVRVVLRPQSLQVSFTETSADDFAKELIRLFESGCSVDELRAYAEIYGFDTLLKFEELLDTLQNNSIDLSIGWINAGQNLRVKKMINKDDRICIKNNLSNTMENEFVLSFRGRFYSLNTKNGAFCFETEDEKPEKIEGKFEKNIIELIQTMSFERIYEITVIRKIKKSLASPEKETNVITNVSLL